MTDAGKKIEVGSLKVPELKADDQGESERKRRCVSVSGTDGETVRVL